MGEAETKEKKKIKLSKGNKKCHDVRCCRSLQEDLSSKEIQANSWQPNFIHTDTPV